ncbi:chromosome transmission fidelity protein 18 homolog isoform X1 [Pieris brassicae]|uniref:chromosome transmission fidelity protein 18 homolog isoform X1 n=2 Tax=Pieris brassicae TaxID=7116 RepID=UPI001E661E41|nr:chromosome transmission fidelity protein 18 homolog isoform X1 [Pieris brassicae]
MSEYPDPDEEYELMYSDELEMMREVEDHVGPNPIRKKMNLVKRSLDFSSTPSNYPVTLNQDINIPSTDQVLTNNDNNSISQDDRIPSHKRTAEELFGDIGDIDFESLQLPNKKQKTEEESDFDLISKIIEGRRLRQMLNEPSNRIQADTKSFYNVKENMSLDIPSWPFMALTNSDGNRVYVKLESEDSWNTSLDNCSNELSLHASLASAWEEARKILENKTQVTNQIDEDVIQTPINENVDLWVDKYRPNSYIDLLSEEPVNRALLHWLHLWDKIVFKKDVIVKEPQQQNKFVKRTGQFQLTNKWKGKKETEVEMDEDGRPHHKVALVCGPPGVGKTTLAHLLAKLAGYRPVELNASDERSTEAFQTALQSATLMRSVLDADKRPNCLILDEIDGAPTQTVELLVKWCMASLKEEGKKKGKSHPLRRPVIAICNDLYATSLRPLRPISLIVTVNAVSQARLSARLGVVAKREHITINPRLLTALAARAQGDVRSALHVLSFCRARGKPLNIDDIENTSFGMKDCNKTMIQALQAIFAINDKDPNAALKIIQAAGEYDRLAEGIFENYLSARVDARLHIACETTSWLRLYDLVYAWILRNQNYSLYGLLPYCLSRCHTVLASRQPFRVKFPMQAQDMFRKKAELESIVSSVWRGSVPSVLIGRKTLLLDVIPLLPYLLSPQLRSGNIQLCSENEKKSVAICAGAMCDYGLQYVQQRTPEGLYAFVLEPNVHRVAFMENIDRVKTNPTVRQAIAQEQQLEIIRRNDQMMTRNCKKTGESKTTRKEKPKPEIKLPNHLQRLQPKAVEKSTPQVHKDFFGRIVPLSQVQKQDAVSDVISSSNVFYQYKEGYNNAVRRNVRMRDLL